MSLQDFLNKQLWIKRTISREFRWIFRDILTADGLNTSSANIAPLATDLAQVSGLPEGTEPEIMFRAWFIDSTTFNVFRYKHLVFCLTWLSHQMALSGHVYDMDSKILYAIGPYLTGIKVTYNEPRKVTYTQAFANMLRRDTMHENGALNTESVHLLYGRPLKAFGPGNNPVDVMGNYFQSRFLYGNLSDRVIAFVMPSDVSRSCTVFLYDTKLNLVYQYCQFVTYHMTDLVEKE